MRNWKNISRTRPARLIETQPPSTSTSTNTLFSKCPQRHPAPPPCFPSACSHNRHQHPEPAPTPCLESALPAHSYLKQEPHRYYRVLSLSGEQQQLNAIDTISREATASTLGISWVVSLRSSLDNRPALSGAVPLVRLNFGLEFP